MKRQSIPSAIRKQVMERDAYRCCGCDDWHDLHIDHIYPVSKGGTNDVNNLQVLCGPCNLRKSDRTGTPLWPKAEWVSGKGRYASVAHCSVVTVMLFPTVSEANAAKAFIDEIGCGHACSGDHEIIDTTGAA